VTKSHILVINEVAHANIVTVCRAGLVSWWVIACGHTVLIYQHFRDKGLTIRRCINSSVYFTYIPGQLGHLSVGRWQEEMADYVLGCVSRTACILHSQLKVLAIDWVGHLANMGSYASLILFNTVWLKAPVGMRSQCNEPWSVGNFLLYPVRYSFGYEFGVSDCIC